MLNRASGRRCVCAEIRFAFLNAFIEILKSEKFRLHLFSCICGTASLFVYCLIIFLIGHTKFERNIWILMGYRMFCIVMF